MQVRKKHIGIVTTWFQPRTGVAVNRMTAFAKYLDPARFNLSVITLEEKNAPATEKLFGADIYRLANDSFLSPLQETAGEHRLIHTLKVLWNICLHIILPFEYTQWKKHAVKKLSEIHSKNKFDAIISSYAPIETHLAADEFCKLHPEIKWIADMRDEMSKNPSANSKTRKKYSELEKQIEKRANAVTTVSEPILNDFKTLMPRVRQFEEIRNGYDHDIQPLNNFNPIFTVAYSGTFYGKRKPDIFFEALKSFMDKTKAPIRILFMGTNKNFSIPGGIASSCEFIAPQPYLRSMNTIATADALLFIQPVTERKGVFSGKLFDYISLMKPIIAACDTTDVAAHLIRETNSGFVADFNNLGEIEKAITAAYTLWKEKQTLPMNKEKIAELHRKYQVKKLEILIDKLVA